jgi:hypothetical protein
MVSRRKFLALTGGGFAASTIGSTTYCSIRGCSNIRNTVTGSPASTIGWTRKVPQPVDYTLRSIAADADNWYIPIRDDGVYAFSKDTGERERILPYEGEVQSPMTHLYLFDDYLVGVSVSTEAWQEGWAITSVTGETDPYHMTNWDPNEISGFENIVAASLPIVVFKGDQQLTAYDVERKQKLWSAPHNSASTAITAGDGTLYMLNYSLEQDAYIMATAPIDAGEDATGDISQFTIKNSGKHDRAIHYHDEKLIIITSQTVAAVTKDGDTAWTYTLPSGRVFSRKFRSFTGPTHKSRLIGRKLIVSGPNSLAVIDTSDGSSIWEKEFEKPLHQVAATSNAIFVAFGEHGPINNTTGTKMLLKTHSLETGEKLGQRAFDEEYAVQGSETSALLSQTDYDIRISSLTV